MLWQSNRQQLEIIVLCLLILSRAGAS